MAEQEEPAKLIVADIQTRSTSVLIMISWAKLCKRSTKKKLKQLSQPRKLKEEFNLRLLISRRWISSEKNVRIYKKGKKTEIIKILKKQY